MSDEKQRYVNILKSAEKVFRNCKNKLCELFDPEAAECELKRVNKHLRKVNAEQN